MFAVFLFLTYYLQQNLGFSPLTTGSGVPADDRHDRRSPSTTVQTRVLPRTGAKPLVVAGMTLGIIAMLLFTRLTPHGAYASQVLPGADPHRPGNGLHLRARVLDGARWASSGTTPASPSAMVNTSQQVGGSVGTALLSTIFASAAASYGSAHAHTAGSPARRRSTATPPRSSGPPASSRSAWFSPC